MSKRLSFFYDVLLEFGEPVSDHAFALRCVPSTFPGQDILDMTLELAPLVPYAQQRDGFGNLLQIGRIDIPHNQFRYTVRGSALLDLSRRAAETAHPVFRFPSLYTTADEAMEDYFASLRLPEPPAQRAWALVEAVQNKMTYLPGITSVSTTAAQAFAAGTGVCQDFAHIYLTLARRAGLTARYVNGLPEGVGASHAWCEVWLNGVWTGVDPTQCRWVDESYIRIGVGRDFGDCPIERGIFLGRAAQRQTALAQVCQQ